MQKILKNERGSVALFVLLSALFFLVVVTGVAVSFKNKETQIDSQFEKIKLSYEKDAEQVYNEAINENLQFSTKYGTIEVIWLQGNTNTVTSIPNTPNMYTGFEKVAWRDDGTEFTPTQDSEWYNYKAISGKEDNTTSKWANAKNTADGSYFVWIPRFAYRITYWDNEKRNHVVGYFDGRGMVDKDGNLITKTINSEERQITLDSEVNTVTQNGKQYIVHPAFDDNVDNGGWKNKLSGFWVAKYEMGKELFNTTSNSWEQKFDGGGNIEITNSNSNRIRAVSKPNITSWAYIVIGNSYVNSYKYDRAKESHLMKKSEWGAVVYLTHSQYGRNGNEVSVNQCSEKYTGAGRGIGSNKIFNSIYSVDTETNLPPIDQQYTGEIGKKSSSTGNLHGVYDLSGGCYEYLAAFDTLGNIEKIEEADNGLKMTANAKDSNNNYVSTEYITIYSIGSNINSENYFYDVGKVGEATKEIYDVSSLANWFLDYASYTETSRAFFRAGGFYSNNSKAGIFYTSKDNGSDFSAYTSFRVILAQ